MARKKRKKLCAIQKMAYISFNIIEYDDEKRPGDDTNDVTESVIPIPLTFRSVFGLVWWFLFWRGTTFFKYFFQAAGELGNETINLFDWYFQFEDWANRHIDAWWANWLNYNYYGVRLRFGGILASSLWWSIST